MVKTRAETRRDKQVRAVLACCRPGGENDGDKDLRDALQHAEADPDLKRDFELQTELDHRVVGFIENVELPPGLLARAEGHWQQARRGHFTWSGLLRHPAFWAALLAVNFLLAWGGWMFVAHLNGFTGDETVVKLIDFAWPAPPARGATAAPKDTAALPQGRGWLAIQGPSGVGMECGKLGDLLMLRHNIDRYYVPPELAGYSALAYRVLEHGGQPAVEIMARALPLGRPRGAGDDSATDEAAASTSPTPAPENIYFFSFRAEGRGIVIEPAGKWKFLVSEKGWAAAVQEREGACFVAATRGDGKEDIQRRLTEANVQF